MQRLEQHELPLRPRMVSVDAELIARQPSMTKALHLCQTLSGKSDQQFTGEGGIVKDAAQWSRIMGAGQHNFPHDKLNQFMDIAGNESPMLWLLHSRGYDIAQLHQRESETERRLRLSEEARAKAEEKCRVLMEAIGGRALA
jgi:hypothetical protein